MRCATHPRFVSSRLRATAIVFLLALLVLAFPSLTQAYNGIGAPGMIIDTITTALDDPGTISTIPGDTVRCFITEAGGTVRIVGKTGPFSFELGGTFLDISSKICQVVDWNNEPENRYRNSLMTIAFPPDYLDSGYFFVHYISQPNCDVVIERYRVSINPDSADPASATVVMTIPYEGGQVTSTVVQGSVTFGPDSLLYIGTSDGEHTAIPVFQGSDTLVGHLLRIDVRELPYSIPPTNPFFGAVDTLPEILTMEPIGSPEWLIFSPFDSTLYIMDYLDCHWDTRVYFYAWRAPSLEFLYLSLQDIQFPCSNAGFTFYDGIQLPELRNRFLTFGCDPLFCASGAGMQLGTPIA